jgi:hypothetical protein
MSSAFAFIDVSCRGAGVIDRFGAVGDQTAAGDEGALEVDCYSGEGRPAL